MGRPTWRPDGLTATVLTWLDARVMAKTGAARRPAARAQRSVLDDAEHAALRRAHHQEHFTLLATIHGMRVSASVGSDMRELGCNTIRNHDHCVSGVYPAAEGASIQHDLNWGPRRASRFRGRVF